MISMFGLKKIRRDVYIYVLLLQSDRCEQDPNLKEKLIVSKYWHGAAA